VKKIFKPYVPEAPISFSKKKKSSALLRYVVEARPSLLNRFIDLPPLREYEEEFSDNTFIAQLTKTGGVCSFSRDLRRSPRISAGSTVTYKEINRQLTPHYKDKIQRTENAKIL